MNTQALAIVFVWHQKDNALVKEIIDYSSMLLSRDVSNRFLDHFPYRYFFIQMGKK